MKNDMRSRCAACDVPTGGRACTNPGGKSGKSCPTTAKKPTVAKARKEYQKPEVGEFARQASIQEGECYAGRGKTPYVMHPTKPRIVEIAEFANKMGYKKLGFAFCLGLAREAAVVGEILEGKGFEVVSVACKAGCVPKETIGIKEDQKIHIGEHETMCNPVLQAMLVNEAKTDFNVLLGLCVGHDSLFFKYAEAPTTVLAVKDRVTGHNPLAAIYISGNYYAWVKEGK
jgi:uncharacterized metal-binding protein